MGLLLLVGSLLLVPSVRWPIYGWLRGEAFYQGMPTSYWSREIQQWNGKAEYGRSVCGKRSSPPSTWIDQVKEHFGLQTSLTPEVLETDAQALPVLRALAKDPNPEVRSCAAQAIHIIRRLAQMRAIDLDPAMIP
ncbi:hypothetical protein AYO44_12130 [Planctomycetaceae bacterium SCGC AG-212-F19]|nr:hypothetical protein AYO44_12130 [Planctomycetaceae bacterium SCGC AG-212-F19]